jgi:uncharacterized protein
MSDNAQIIVKIVERCNLDCSYCYMYHGADQSWRTRPALLSTELQDLLVGRCADYLAADDMRVVTLEFHGGEPLLIGRPAFEDLLRKVRADLGERASLCIQTNGLLLDDAWLELFETYGVSWSISCDGPAAVSDRFRLDHMGRSSHQKVEDAIRLSQSRNSIHYGGVLAVIDPSGSAREIVHYFRDLGVQDFDLLLPDASHHALPSHLPEFSMEQVRDYLIEAFDAWIEIGDPDFKLRFFTHIMKGLFGLHSGLDAFGGELWGMLVVESDGSYQHLDVMRINGEGEVTTGMSLVEHTLDEYLAKTKGAAPEACQTCKDCPVFRVCGGGYAPHRFDGESYDNPSVYCDVLYALIAHIDDYLRNVTPTDIWAPVAAEVPATAMA